MSDEKLFGEGFKAQSVEDLDKSGTREKLEEAEARGTKPGLFEIFSARVEKEDAEEEEAAAEENDEGEEEDAEEDDQEDEMQLDCAQPAAEDPEKKYTTFATKNGFEVMYKQPCQSQQQKKQKQKQKQQQPPQKENNATSRRPYSGPRRKEMRTAAPTKEMRRRAREEEEEEAKQKQKQQQQQPSEKEIQKQADRISRSKSRSSSSSPSRRKCKMCNSLVCVTNAR
ncbi:hypothetical protein CYMTET_23956 [Cymbomonas tetramitiformis]|uniref:Uncharacterized protein n=1 Tax=Cymbomonas tetramitiformis TaxID=36881 RepID=A0AAE0FX20_9CHLO|nr:hypothetical protein CYMTET_23956 [Cymbomonas tetramitiformis]